MKRPTLVIGLISILVFSGCATAPVPDSASVLHDELFAPAPAKFDPQSLFQLNDAMRRCLRIDIASKLADKGPMRGSHDALYSDKELKLQDPAFVPAQLNLAVIYRRAGHSELALNTLNKVLSRDPNNVSALSNLVSLL